MAEEIKEKETAEEETNEAENTEEAAEEETEAEGKTKKKKKPLLSPNTIEVIVAIFLGVTALLTAWATWIGSLHGGNQATNYTKSNNIAAEGNSEYNAAMQLYLSDLTAWNTIVDYSFQAEVANAKGEELEEQMIRAKIDNYSKDNCSSILNEAADQMVEQGLTSPFEVEGMTDKYFEKANQLLVESEELLKQGMEDNKHGDAYNLVNVIYSVVLFLLGIVGIFKRLPNRAVVLVIAIVGVVIATIYMCTIPLPTGFDIMSFFNGG